LVFETPRPLPPRSWRILSNTMNCTDLALRIEQLQPEATPKDVARLCLLLSNTVDTVDHFKNEDTLASAWKEMGLRLQVATDQHAAMTQELEDLARSDPRKFTPDQIWVLIRAIKVQSQILQFYVGGAELDV
jgi:hypothetical protein